MTILDRRAFLTTTAAGLAALSAGCGETQAAAEDDPLGVRGEFPAAENQTFLNTAWVGPIPSRRPPRVNGWRRRSSTWATR